MRIQNLVMNSKILLFLVLTLFGLFGFVQSGIAGDKVLKVDIRHRPPEMIVNDTSYTGPLIDIIQEIATTNGYQIQYHFRQFYGSMILLKQGRIDILPRTICTMERAQSIDYLGPIGYQTKKIVFIVRPGLEDKIHSFEDLVKFNIGTKKGTFYYDEFNNNNRIKKVETYDDENLVRMYDAGRFDVFIALDKKSALAAFEKEGITQFAFAKYFHTRHIGNYFGIAKDHPARTLLQKTLEEMVKSGRISKIYQDHGVTPPVFTDDMVFQKCF